MKYIVEGYWKCPSCGTKDIKGHVRECPNCGKPRDEDVKFYLKEFDESHALKDASTEPDWLCEYCGCYSPSSSQECISCGAPKNGKHYSDTHDTNKKRVYDTNNDGIDDESQFKKEEKIVKTIPKQPLKKTKTNFYASIAVALILVIAGLIYYFVPRSVDFDVTGVSWKRQISIERFTTVEESDWSVPAGGRVYKTQQEIHHYDKVLDHYEDYYEDVSEQVLDHYETITHKRDLGNGNFEIEKEQKPVYKTVTHKEKRSKPVYIDIPIYETKFYYKLERWKHFRNVDSSGDDLNPYWGSYVLAKGKPPYNVGEERIAKQTEHYYVNGIVDKEEKTFSVSSYDWWQSMTVGSHVHGKSNKTDNLEKDD